MLTQWIFGCQRAATTQSFSCHLNVVAFVEISPESLGEFLRKCKYGKLAVSECAQIKTTVFCAVANLLHLSGNNVHVMTLLPTFMPSVPRSFVVGT